MKILLINNFHYRKGGSETVYFNTAELLRSHGHEVVFFSFADEKNLSCSQRKYFVERKGALVGLADYFYNRRAAEKLEQLIQEEKPEIAHVHLFWGGISPSIFRVLEKYGIPLVHTCHDYRLVCPGYTFTDGGGSVCERCGRWNYYQCAFHRCSKGSLIRSILMSAEMYFRELFFNPVKFISGFIFVSHFAENKHIQHNGEYKNTNRTVIYNYTSPYAEPEVSKKENYLLYYGRLSPEKGINTLLSVVERHPEWKLKVVGTGSLEDGLVKQYGKSDNIEFLGYRSGNALFDLVRKAGFVCVPSEWFENNPMTIIESYSLGTPVVGAEIGGIPEIVKDGSTGYLFKSSDALSLETTLRKAMSLTNDEYCRICAEAHLFYERNFSAEEHYRKLMDFYCKVLGREPGAEAKTGER